MRAELANLNNSAVLFLSSAAVNLCWYNYSRTKNKWDYKGLEIIVSHRNLRDAAREILTF